MITNEDLQKAFYCSHKLQNLFKRICEEQRHELACGRRHVLEGELLIEVLQLMDSGSYWIKVMHNQLGGALRHNETT